MSKCIIYYNVYSKVIHNNIIGMYKTDIFIAVNCKVYYIQSMLDYTHFIYFTVITYKYYINKQTRWEVIWTVYV